MLTISHCPVLNKI
nr:unnamed protein product [Callosobruchus analis]